MIKLEKLTKMFGQQAVVSEASANFEKGKVKGRVSREYWSKYGGTIGRNRL